MIGIAPTRDCTRFLKLDSWSPGWSPVFLDIFLIKIWSYQKSMRMLTSSIRKILIRLSSNSKVIVWRAHEVTLIFKIELFLWYLFCLISYRKFVRIIWTSFVLFSTCLFTLIIFFSCIIQYIFSCEKNRGKAF